MNARRDGGAGRAPILFEDRVDAGRRLAARLESYRGQKALVLGLARGGMPVAAEVARHLRADLDVLVVKKLGVPGNPELALAAVGAEGDEFWNEDLLERASVSEGWRRAEALRAAEEARRCEDAYRAHRPALPLHGRIVILVDDGLATGASLRAALHTLRRSSPARRIGAVPVGSRAGCAVVAQEADDVVCHATIDDFRAVGQHYRNFDAVPEEEVRALLEEAAAARA